MTDTSVGFNQATGKTSADEAKRKLSSMMREKRVFEDKAAEYRDKFVSRQSHDRLDLDRKHDAQKTKLDSKLHDAYGKEKSKDQAALKALNEKKEKAQLTKKEQDRAKAHQMNLENIKQRETEQRNILKSRQDAERKKMGVAQDKESERTERAISAARQDRQSKGWKPEPVNFDRFRQSADEKISFQKPSRKTVDARERGEAREVAPNSLTSSPRPYLAPKGAKTGNLHPPKESASEQSGGGRGSGKGQGMGM